MFKFKGYIFISTDERDDFSSDANELLDDIIKTGSNIIVYDPNDGIKYTQKVPVAVMGSSISFQDDVELP